MNDPRFLTGLEMRRITGTRILKEQVIALDSLGIPYRARKLSTGYLIGINVYTHEVEPVIGRLAWDVVKDESIGTGFKRAA